MGGTEIELLKYIIGWFFRWLISKKKNREKKKQLKQKKKE